MMDNFATVSNTKKINQFAPYLTISYICFIKHGTQSSMVDKRNRFLFFLFLLVSVCVHTHECFNVGREIFGTENVMPLGNNDDDDNPKTTLAMEKTTNDYDNAALVEVQTPEDKNPSINLLEKI